MNRAHDHDERIAKMTFASVYPHYLSKVEKKGRTKEELHQVINWLTGCNEKTLQKHIKDKVTFEQFFQHATINPNAHLITGVICGYRVEEIENPLTQQVRYLDKLVDELAKGRKIGRFCVQDKLARDRPFARARRTSDARADWKWFADKREETPPG